jgi:hypothetical protein
VSEVAEAMVDAVIARPPVKVAHSSFRLPRSLEILLGIVVVLELIIPFVTTTYGIDGGLHLNWIGQFIHLLSQGVWIPRWVPEGFWGFGAATFYFYPPVTFYLAALIHGITGSNSVTFLYQMTGLVATVASFFSMRLLLRSLRATSYQANLGALLFAFAPFRMAELYSRSSLSTHVSYAVLPLVCLGVVKVFEQRLDRRFESIVLLGSMVALLALTNVPMTMVTAVCAAIALTMNWRRLSRPILLDFFRSGVIAMALSAFHFSAVIAAKPYARLEDLKAIDMEFLLTDLYHRTGFAAAFHVGLIYIAIGIIGYYYWRSTTNTGKLSSKERSFAAAGIVIMAIALFLEIPKYSLPIWRNIPPFPIIQFPWRFYSYIVLIASLIVGIASTPAMVRAARTITWAWVVGAFLPAALLVTNFHLFSHVIRPIEDATEYRPIHSPERTKLSSTLAPLALSPSFSAVLSSHDTVSLISYTPITQSYNIRLSKPLTLTFHRFWWPYWHLMTANRELSCQYDSVGRVTSVLPAGQYVIQWELHPTPIEQAGLWVSKISVGLLLVCFGYIRYRRS